MNRIHCAIRVAASVAVFFVAAPPMQAGLWDDPRFAFASYDNSGDRLDVATRTIATANTANTYTGGSAGSLLTASSWSLGHVATATEDAIFLTNPGIRTLSAANLSIGSLNVTALTGTFSIRNETTTSSDRSLILGGPSNGGNAVSGTATDLLYVASGATLVLRGDNPSGSGVLKVVLGQSGTFDAAGALTITAAISDGGSAFGFTKIGAGTLTLSGANSYSGGTTIDAGTVQLSGGATLGGSTSPLTVNSGTLALGGTNQIVGTLSGTGGTISTTGTSTLTVGNDGGSGTYAGTITNAASGVIHLTKTGGGTQTLTNLNSYSGLTTVNGGTLELKNTSGVALSGTSGIQVNNRGTLLFSASNQLNQAVPPPITLGTSGGTGPAPKIDAGGASQGGINAAGNSGLGALTLNVNSTISLTGTSVLHFADSSGPTWQSAALLSITNWNGSPLGGGTEQLLFGNGGVLVGVTGTQLAQIQFIDPVGFSPGTYSAIYAATDLNEIVPGTPIPEPATWISATLALASVASYRLMVSRYRASSRATRVTPNNNNQVTDSARASGG